jgi:beta-galactosidase
VQWVLFKDEYIARALGDFAAMLDDVGLGEIARFHNLPPGHHGLYDLRWIQSRLRGPVGIDAYTPRAQFSELRRRALALVGEARPIPIAFEVGIGFFPWFPPLDASDDPTRERDHLLTLLAAGVRGFNLFMAVERDRYYGAAISAAGVVEAHAAWIKPLLATLAEVDWPALRRATPIAVMNTRADERFGIASCTIDPMTPVLADALGLGLGGATELGTDKAAIESRKWQSAVCRALELAQVPYVIVDEGALADELAAYRAIIAPTLDRIDQTPAEQLRLVAEEKRAIVVIGPGTPTRDEFDQAIEFAPKRVGRLKAGSLDDLPGLAEDLATLAGDVSEAWQVERPDQVRTSVFATDAGVARVVFVTSDSDRPATAVVLAAEGVKALRDGVAGESLKVIDGRVTIALQPRGVRLFVIE